MADPAAVVRFTDLPELRRRLPRLVVGLLLLGTGIGMTLRAHLGVSPYDVLHQGIASHTGISFGSVVVLVGIVVLVLWIPLRQRPGVGTVVNTLTVGYITNAVFDVIGPVHQLGARWSLLLGGVLITAAGVGVYIGCGLGPGPRDGLMTGIAARGHPLWLVRTVLELLACGCGYLLGGNVGVGTLVFAFGIGPAGHFFLHRFHLGVDVVDPDPDATFGE
ncbi:MAG: membrane protein YczE [Acidimicrobiia bacterium]